MEDYPKPVKKNCAEKILFQMNNSIYKIKEKKEKNKFCFFCTIKYKNKNIPVIIVNNYSFDESNNKSISIIINNRVKQIKLGKARYTNKDLNISIIEVEDNDINEINFFEIDDNLYKNDFKECYFKESIYILHYDNENDITVSFGVIKNIKSSQLIYLANVNNYIINSQGFPIFNLTTNKLIGIHNYKSKYNNSGIPIKYLIDEFIQYYIDKIPIEITKKWLDMEAFNEFIYQLIENSDIIKRNFIKTNMISKLIDFILGKKSPLYKGDERSEFINTKGYFGPIIKSIALLFKYYDKNILDEDMTLSDDDINLINHEQFYDKIVKDNYESNATNLLIDIKINLVLAINIKENMPINDQDILDYLNNKRIEKIKMNEDINSYLDLLVNIIKKYSLVYLNKDNDLLLEKLNILLGLPIPTVNFNEAEIIYVSGKYYGKNTILTKLSKNLEINKDMIILLITLFDLITINDFVFNYVDNLPSPNSFKYSYVDYIIKLFLSYQNELKKIDETAINKLSDAFILIFQKHNKKDLDDISVYDELYFSNFSYELKNNEKLDLYEVKIKYSTLKEPQKTNLELFNKTTFFSNLNNKDKIEEQKEEKKEEEKEGNQLDTFICALVFCNDDLDINIEFKPYFNSKLEIKGKKNCHYIFYCTKEEKTIDYSKIKIETKVIQQPQQPQQQTSTLNQLLGLPQDMKLKIALPTGLSLKVPCEVCGIENLITSETTEFKCSFCECPLIKPASFIF